MGLKPWQLFVRVKTLSQHERRDGGHYFLSRQGIGVATMLGAICLTPLLLSIFVSSAVLLDQPVLPLSEASNQPAAPLYRPLIFQRNVSAGNPLQIECNAPLYGRNIKVPSCKKVVGIIVFDDEQLVFADRSGLIPFNIPLPYRLQSSKHLEILISDIPWICP